MFVSEIDEESFDCRSNFNFFEGLEVIISTEINV